MDKHQFTASSLRREKWNGRLNHKILQAAADHLGLSANIGARALANGILQKSHRGKSCPTKAAAKAVLYDFYRSVCPSAPQTEKRPTPKRVDAPQRSAAKRAKWVGEAANPENFYWSEEWRRLRYEALRASRGICELCGSGPSKGKPLHVDHIKPRSRYPELELTLSNLQVLCADCNLGKSNTDEIDWRRSA